MNEISTSEDEAFPLVSKMLVLDGNADCRNRLKIFCAENRLVALKAQEDNVMAVLRSNVDLGGILISERLGGGPEAGIELGRRIHAIRPELPLFLRRDAGSLSDLPPTDQRCFSAAYTIDTIDTLRSVISECIFSMVYPNALVRGITEITRNSLSSQFKDLQLEIETPYLVRDRLIFGEIFTLIPIESTWCRGYMMLQTEEASLQQIVKAARTHFDPAEGDDFRNLNAILGEITNLIWGAFKNRYIGTESVSLHLAQVPIVINHQQRYISFGSVNPQLCFKCTLSDLADASVRPVVIYQRFVFNLNWSPDDFRENETPVENLMASGELEFF